MAEVGQEFAAEHPDRCRCEPTVFEAAGAWLKLDAAIIQIQELWLDEVFNERSAEAMHILARFISVAGAVFLPEAER